MLLFYIWKTLKYRILYIFILSSTLIFGQSDTSAYTSFKNKVVLYADLGYTTAPFSVHYKFSPEVDKLI